MKCSALKCNFQSSFEKCILEPRMLPLHQKILSCPLPQPKATTDLIWLTLVVLHNIGFQINRITDYTLLGGLHNVFEINPVIAYIPSLFLFYY